MKKQSINSIIFYFFLLAISVLATWWAIKGGLALEAPEVSATHTAPSTHSMTGVFNVFQDTVLHHLEGTMGLLLLQIIVILLVARVVGWIFNRMGQPTVIGEILAGILLGPSLFGYLWPEGFNWLFSSASLSTIRLLSQFGLILFMFAIGMELNLTDIRKQARKTLIISHAGIIIPFALGAWLAYFTYTSYASDIAFLPYALFVGVAMSITAFPVLARIIQERNMGNSHLGKLALSTAALGDISAWLILAAIMAVTMSGSIMSAFFNFLFLLVYLIIMFGVVLPVFRFVGKLYDSHEVISKTMVGFIFILLMISSFVTEILSMHALFGAFIMGLVMPEDLKFRKIMTEKVEDVSLSLFLPLFFVSSGLETQLGLLNTPAHWYLFALITIIAIVGKVGGTYIAARATGEGRKESLYLGAFMNTRGLMELVVLSIGYSLGVLPQIVFTILVLMTLVTTFMTTPLLATITFFFNRSKRRKDKRLLQHGQLEGGFRVLVSFGRAESGARLLRVADMLLTRGERKPSVTALHITKYVDTNPVLAETFAEESFLPLLKANESLNLPLETRYELADSPEQRIIDIARDGEYSLLLVGAGLEHSTRKTDREIMAQRSSLRRRIGRLAEATEKLMSASGLLRDKTDFFCHNSSASVGTLIDQGFTTPKRILLIVDSAEDMRLLPYGRVLASNNGGSLSILPVKANLDFSDSLHKSDILLEEVKHPPMSTLADYDFMLVSYNPWLRIKLFDEGELTSLPSTLILNLK